MLYVEELNRVINEWSTRPLIDEWLFENFREDVIGNMSSEEAFANIGVTIKVLLEQTDESCTIELLETIGVLAGHSNTTEVPKELLEAKDLIIQKVKSYGDYAQSARDKLFRYYRLK